MLSANRYLVWWQSSVSGEHYETKSTPAAAQDLLDKREQREYFVRGVVIDLDDYTSSPEEFMAHHRRSLS